jgi:plastocyanin
VTITAAGVSPQDITVDAGTQLAFTNNDIAPHDIAGGPDPAHPDCHEIDAVGFLTPGQTKRTGTLTRTCDYHDHGNHSPIFTGRIIVR